MLGFGVYLMTDKWLFRKLNSQEKCAIPETGEDTELEENE